MTEQDYVEVSLDGNIRYNPLNNSLDPYAQAFNIASIITSIWGRGKEPFWQQSYTDLVHRLELSCGPQSSAGQDHRDHDEA